MFHATAEFDHVTPFQLETILSHTPWTDVVRITVGELLVYEDRAGISNDLVPALDEFRQHREHGQNEFEIVLGQQNGPFVSLCRIVSNPLQIRWHLCVRDVRVEPAADEAPEQHRERVRGWLAEGYLAQMGQAMTDSVVDDVLYLASQGLPLREETVSNPWIQVRGTDPLDVWGDLHRIYGGTAPPLLVDRMLLSELFDDPGAPAIDVMVDHLGEVVSLSRFREILVELAMAPPAYPPAVGEEAPL